MSFKKKSKTTTPGKNCLVVGSVFWPHDALISTLCAREIGSLDIKPLQQGLLGYHSFHVCMSAGKESFMSAATFLNMINNQVERIQ